MELTDLDYQIIIEALQRNFTAEQIEAMGVLDYGVDAAMRRSLSEYDPEFFGRFYLRHHISRPPAPMHREVFAIARKLMTTPGRQNQQFILPRGFAKTTIITGVTPLWAVCCGLRKHIVIISDSFPQAKDQLGTIKTELEDNERIREDFGDMKGSVWQSADIESANGVRIRALGSGMKIRGRKKGEHRPDLIILDDIEEIEGVESQISRDRLHSWFLRSVMPAGFDDTKVIVVGNKLHYDCLLSRLEGNPMFRTLTYKAIIDDPIHMDLWYEWRSIVTDISLSDKDAAATAFYEAHKDEMNEGARVAWPEAFSLYSLMMIWATIGDAAFSMEYQNDPSDPSKRVFHWTEYRKEGRGEDTWLVPLDNKPAARLRDCVLFAATDPSLGKTNRADPSAILIGALAPSRLAFVIEADIKVRRPEKIIQDQIDWLRRYPQIIRWGIEQTGFQAFFATESLTKAIEAAGVRAPFVAINNPSNKDARILGIQPDLQNALLLLPEHGADVLKMHLEQWPNGAKDDGPDALEMLNRMIREYVPLSGSSLIQGETYSFLKGDGSPRLMQPESMTDVMDEEADRRIREYLRSQGQEVPEASPIFTPRMG